MKLEDLAGRGAVITGSGSGIGRAVAHTLSEAGMRVVVADLSPERSDAVAKEIVERGGQAIAVPTDVTQMEAVQALADTAYDAYGDIAVLHNNAGVSWNPFRALWDADLNDFKWTFDVNYFGVLHGLFAFVPRMRETSTLKQIDKRPRWESRRREVLCPSEAMFD